MTERSLTDYLLGPLTFEELKRRELLEGLGVIRHLRRTFGQGIIVHRAAKQGAWEMENPRAESLNARDPWLRLASMHSQFAILLRRQPQVAATAPDLNPVFQLLGSLEAAGARTDIPVAATLPPPAPGLALQPYSSRTLAGLPAGAHPRHRQLGVLESVKVPKLPGFNQGKTPDG